MYKKVFKYKDFDGHDRVEEAYFNLTKAEVMMWMTTNKEYTLDKLLIELTRVGDVKRIMEIFEDLILRSYGEKSIDGRRFIKSEELRENFKQTEMYSELFMELVGDSNKAANFVNSIMPKDLEQDLDAILANKDKLPVSMQEYVNSIPAVAEAANNQPTPPSILPLA